QDPLAHDARLDHEVPIGEIARQVGVAFGLHAALVGAPALGCALPIAAEQPVDHFHTACHLAKGGKSHPVELGVVRVVDEDLGSPRVGPRGGKGDEATLVGLLDRIVRDAGVAPDCVHLALTVDTPLHHEALDHAKEANVVEVAVLDQIEESVRTLRRPIPLHLDHEAALRGGELGSICRRCLLFESIDLEKRRLIHRRAGRRRRRHWLRDLCGWLPGWLLATQAGQSSQDERARNKWFDHAAEHTAGQGFVNGESQLTSPASDNPCRGTVCHLKRSVTRPKSTALVATSATDLKRHSRTFRDLMTYGEKRVRLSYGPACRAWGHHSG